MDSREVAWNAVECGMNMLSEGIRRGGAHADNHHHLLCFGPLVTPVLAIKLLARSLQVR